MLVRELLKSVSLGAYLRFERGSNIFTEIDHTAFWLLLKMCLGVAKDGQTQKNKFVLMISARDKSAAGFEEVMGDLVKQASYANGFSAICTVWE